MHTMVIGAGFGDEGKGRTVDYLTRNSQKHSMMVVRNNGGAQAGHTVERNGKRFVFHSLGSGTLNGVPTLWGPNFIVNPWMVNKEIDDLRGRWGQFNICDPVLDVYVDWDARVATPWDAYVNQALETSRTERHGSCGQGIFETVNRSKQEAFKLTVSDLVAGDKTLRGKLTAIQQEWLPARLKELGIELLDDAKATAYSPECMETVIRDARKMMDQVTSVDSWGDVGTRVERFVFEGAQGLLLSENNEEFFPHLTPSDTGVKPMFEMVDALGIAERGETIDMMYVTRPYATRHGNGPMPSQEPELHNMLSGFSDPTNQNNPWQGQFRLGTLDVPRIKKAIRREWEVSNEWATDRRCFIDSSLHVTCLDHLPSMMAVVEKWNGTSRSLTYSNRWHLCSILENLGLPTVRLVSYGPEAKNTFPVPEAERCLIRAEL